MDDVNTSDDNLDPNLTPASEVEAAAVSEVKGAAEVKEASKETTGAGVSIPSLNKETWEYIELKLWDSFRKKLWIILTSTLTVAGIVASLGLNNWIKSSVQEILASQRVEFEKARRNYVSNVEQQLLLAALIDILQNRLESDILEYSRFASEVKDKLSHEQLSSAMGFKSIAYLFNLNYIGDIDDKLDVFRSEIKEFQTKAGIVDEDSGFGHTVNQVDEIRKLRSWRVHLYALSSTITELKGKLFQKMAADPDRLTSLYNQDVLESYNKKLNEKGVGMFAGQGISSLSSADVELRFYIKNPFWEQFDKN